MEAAQQNILNSNEELIKATQFQHVFLSLPWKYFLFMIKSKKNVHSLNIFDNKYLYTAYADDTLLFLKDMHFIKKCFKRPNSRFQILKDHFPNSMDFAKIYRSAKFQDSVS